MAESLSAKFTEWIKAVERLRDVIESGYGDMTTTRSLPECCTAPLGEKDIGFKQRAITIAQMKKEDIYDFVVTLTIVQVNKDEICAVGVGLKQTSVKYINRDDVLKTMKNNMAYTASLKWQYFASEQGVFFSYPTLKYCDDNYQPRFRPFYVGVASPQPKDLVVVIDTSGSMRSTHKGRSLMQIAIEAATTVVDTLGPNDRTPSGTVFTSSCFGDTLAMATPKTKRYLTKDFLQNLKEGGITNYGPALRTAFQYFTNTAGNETTNGQEREKLILFLTDGEPTDNEAMQTLREENAKLGNKVILFTFGFGGGSSWQTLINMAAQTTADTAAGEVTPGYFIYVKNPSDLRSQMGLYYTHISKTGRQPTVIFSVPYKDYFGTGILISACLPVYHNGELKGVVGIDRAVSDLLSDVTYFNKGELNYAFVIDGQARVLTHPMLPRLLTIRDDPLFIRLPSLERSPQVLDVMTSMLRGETANLTFPSERVTSRGNSRLEGVQTRNILSTYFWSPVEHTHFSVCVVLAEGAETSTDVWEMNLPQSFIYHRFDLKPQPNQCSYLHRVAVKDKSSVKFAPTAFVDAYEYLDTEETKNTVNRYELYMVGKGRPVGFKEGVRESVASTHQLDAILSTRSSRYAIWRYIGTEAGIFRVYPGTRMVKEFDHTQRPWYKRGINLKGLATLSTPYKDASGSGTVLTLSHSIYQGRSSQQHGPNDPVTAVMGIDFTLPNLHYLLLDTYPACKTAGNRCFLVDISGFIVLHRDFFEDISSDKIVHISTKEPLIARDLVARNIMKQAACVNVQEFSNQYFWQISLQLAHNGHVSSSFYTLAEVPGSNVFVVIATGPSSSTSRECTWCHGKKDLPRCTSAQCHCPCYSPSDIYEYCKDTFSLQADGWPVCVPQSAVVSLEDLKAEESGQVARLDACFDYQCDANLSRSDCLSTSSCTWCAGDGVTDEKQRRYPYCIQGQCSTPAVGTGDATTASTTATASTNATASASKLGVILPAVLGLVVVVVIACVAVWMCRRKRHPRPIPPTQTHTNTGFRMDDRPPPTAPPHGGDLPPAAPYHGGDIPPPYSPS
ncbi:VWFA and cache domain-containing protein 1 [Lamellibrachia satsuma]|nr:VWFA and cache domain-containing protein 1 [Lamellibrachia satsuma]